MILATSENLLEEKKSLELLLLVRLLEAEFHIVVISGAVLGRREQPLLCEGADQCCRAWPGYLPSPFRQPPAPRTCSACTGPVLSLYKSLLKALCSCDTGTKLTELMWAEQSSSSVCSRWPWTPCPAGLVPVSGWVCLQAPSGQDPPLLYALVVLWVWGLQLHNVCFQFFFFNALLLHISVLCLYVYVYIKKCLWVCKQYLYLHTNLFMTQYYQYTKYYAI